MDNLLKLAIEAYGGLERWRQFNVVSANASIHGRALADSGLKSLETTVHINLR